MSTEKDTKWDNETILAANEHFYAVLRSGDFAAMEALWSGRDSVSVYHPNWPGIIGRDDVMASWYQVMVLADPPEIFPRDQRIIRTGRTAMVFCTEVIDDAKITASNVFILEEDGWRMTNHHACPIPTAIDTDGAGDGAQDKAPK